MDNKKIILEIRKKIDELRASEQSKSSDLPLSVQMESDLYDFSNEEKSITLSFPVLQKELNPNGAMMGGLISAAMDITYGILVYSLSGGKIIPPTITMTTNFINPIFFEDVLLVTAKIESWGKRIINMSAYGVSKNTGKKIVTSTTSFVSTEAFGIK
ncbi:hypothetical protein IMSAG049_01558 [Clostridiales bacterium]|nr:hypothetical protein IMSAG049_01558 [Clostridiales bacterium]